MRNLFLIMFVALLCCSSNEALASAITQDEALVLVKSNRSAEGLSNTDVNFYITEVDTIVNNYRCPVDMTTVTEQWLTDDTPKWLVFVDEEPLKVWLHDCSYYYIGQNNQLVRFSGILPPEGLQSFSVERNLTIDNSNLPIPHFPSRARLSRSVNDVNLLADSTYIVLAVKGETLEEEMQFMRDIRLIYQMLTNVYGISKSHIRVFTTLFTGEYVNPETMNDFRVYYDIDGDGEDEYIEPGAYYVDAVKEFTNGQLYPDSRHVFLFHEALYQGIVTGLSDVRQWRTKENGARILNVFTAAGPGISDDDRDEDNKVVTRLTTHSTRTSDDPYNQNVVAWVNALSRCDVFTGVPVASDTDNNGYISMAEAAGYSNLACENQMRCTSLSEGLQNVVSFDRCPSSPMLTIRDNVQDTGDEPNVNGVTWNSPDIWYRNQDDGVVNQISETIDESAGQYIYVRVHNNSDEEYEGYGQKVYLALSDMESLVYEDREIETCDYYVVDSIRITQHIAAHSTGIVKCPADLAYSGCGANYNNIIASVGYCMPNYLQDYYCIEIPTPKEDNRLAMSTLAVYAPSAGNNRWVFRGNGPVAVDRTCTGYDIPLTLEDVETIEISSPFANASDRGAFTVGIQLPLNINASASGFNREPSHNIYILNSNTAQISSSSLANSNINLKLYSNGLIAISDKKYCFDMAFKNNDGDIIGGVSVLLTAEGTGTGGGPIIMMSEGNGNIELTATNLPSNTSVNWYGENMESVGESEVISIAPEDLQNRYTMIATEDGTGSLAIDSIDLSSYNSILNTFINGTDVIVKLTRPAQPGTCLALTSYNTSGLMRNILIENNSTDVIVPAGDLESGIYILSLTVNGKTVSNQTFVK